MSTKSSQHKRLNNKLLTSHKKSTHVFYIMNYGVILFLWQKEAKNMGATTSSFGADLGLQVAGAVAQPFMEQGSYYLGKLTGYNDDIAKDQLEQQRKLAEQAQGIAFKGMDKSQELNKDMFDYTFAKQSKYDSASEQVKRYKDAGLNPALMYSQGNAGMAGGTTGNASAPQVSGGNASDESARRSNNIAAQGMALQLSRQAAEIENIKADTKLKETNTGNVSAGTDAIRQSIEESQTRINNIIQDTDNKRTQNRLMDLQGNYQEIINSFQKELSEKSIKKLSADIDYLNQDTERLVLSNYITKESKENLVINSQLQNANLALNILKGKAQIKEIEANILVLKTTKDLNEAKTAGEKILNAINEVEKDNTVSSGMTKETGTFAPLVNGLRAGITGINNLIDKITN